MTTGAQGSFTKIKMWGYSGGQTLHALLTSDQMLATGYSAQGNLGVDIITSALSSVGGVKGKIGTIQEFTMTGSGVATGLTVLYTDGRIAVCGSNAFGQLGIGSTSNAAVLHDVLSVRH
jgi:alpha-tubulin suppressor-like RCC1 family protein